MRWQKAYLKAFRVLYTIDEHCLFLSIMKLLVLFFALLVSNICYSQQDSRVKIRGDGNDITIKEQGGDSAQKTNVDIDGDENNVKSTQIDTASLNSGIEKKGIMDYVNNTNIIIGLLVSITALWGIIKGISFTKKTIKKR